MTDSSLTFVGIPYRTEIQVYWTASVLAGKLSLPSTEQMLQYSHQVQQSVAEKQHAQLNPSNAHSYLNQEIYCNDIIHELNQDPTRQYAYAWTNWVLSRHVPPGIDEAVESNGTTGGPVKSPASSVRSEPELTSGADAALKCSII